jgi:hypothetical protein
LKPVDEIRWTELLLNVGKARGFVGRNMECDEEQMRCKGTSNMSDEGVGFFWWGWFVIVSNVHGMHSSAGWPKQGLRVLVTMPTVGEIGSADLCGCRFVKGKSAAQIVDKHWLDNGMSKPGRKTRQGHRQTRTRAVKEFGREDIGSLHADANSAAQELAAYTQMQIRQRAAACASQGLDLARSKTWTKDCPRHTNDSTADAAKQAVRTALWIGRT